MLKKSLVSVLFLNCIFAFSFTAFADFFPQYLETDRMLAEFEHDFAENVDKKNNEKNEQKPSDDKVEEKKNENEKYVDDYWVD